jgi:hypothetical protein
VSRRSHRNAHGQAHQIWVMPPSTTELDAIDVATFVGSEEGDRFGNFVQGSAAAERDAVHNAVRELFDLFFSHAQGIAEPEKGIAPGRCPMRECIRHGWELAEE